MKYILSLLLICITKLAYAQEYNFKSHSISRQIIKQVNILKTHNEFNDEAVGYSGYKSDTYKIFERIFNRASIKEWIELCKHPKPIIRYYAFYALEKHKVTTEILTPIVLNHLNDTAKIITFYGCFGDEEMIGSFMFSSIQNEYEQSTKLKKQIDSLFLYAKGPLISQANSYIQNVPKTEKLRKRLQGMVKYENNKYALDLLLSYNNPEDWTYIKYVIKSHPLTALKGINKYPKKDFIIPLQWWKTNLSTPYLDPETWDKYPQNPNIIWGVYRAYMNYEPSIRNTNFIEIFETNYYKDIKSLHARIIYSLLVNNNKEWTLPIKLAILPYLSECDKEYIDQLATHYPDKTLEIFKNITTRYKPYMSYKSECSQAIINQLLKTNSKDSIEFLRTELQHDLAPLFFDKYYKTLTKLTYRIEEDILIHRLKQKIKTEKVELSASYIDLLNGITNRELRKEIWWICYNHIQKNDKKPIKHLLKLMDHYNAERTIVVCKSLFLSGTLKFYANWDVFSYLWNQQEPQIETWLRNQYNTKPYTFKASRLGQYMQEKFNPIKY